VGSDPVRDGFVASFSHPGGNVTGITFFTALWLSFSCPACGQVGAVDSALARQFSLKAEALIIGGDPLFESQQRQIAELAAHNGLPTISFSRSYPLAGGLISYGANLTPMFRLVGIDTGRILKGAKPADLPVQQATEVELVINLKTAKALGLEISPQLLARADEVIE
jgi:putative tryptophan/tyrosine transport system substrate-binding protein